MSKTHSRNAPAVPTGPAALPFLPALYVAWADGDLTAEELAELRRKVGDAPLSQEDRAALQAWLDPGDPPAPRALQALLATVRREAERLAPSQRESLSELGAKLTGAETGPETRLALEAVEEALGVVGEEAARELLDLGAEPEEGDAFPALDVEALETYLDGELRPLRQSIRELLQQPLFDFEYGLPKEARRIRVFKQLKAVAAEGLGAISYPPEYGGEADNLKFAAAFETLAYGDISLVIKYGVQFGLFGGAIRMLGTKPHHDRYLRDAGTAALPGCFAMTELGHGSNVADIETTATYDAATGEIVVNTPSDSAHKEYIGNAALHGRLAVVFAQLLVEGQSHGVHAVLVPIRNNDGSTAPGVRIEDCGEKEGLNGVDNGRLWFDHVRVPRTNLLNRFGDINEDGAYVSPIASPSKRFFTMIGALVAGRVSIALAAMTVMKTGLAIAIRYGERRQFGPAGGDEIRILDYLTHQRRLLPRLAQAYALHFALRRLAERFASAKEEDSREIEALAAGLKAYATWANLDALQQCRECCGGQGYMAASRLPSLKNDTDIFCTFEGDNTVLMQLLVKALLSDYKRQFEDMRPFTLLKYLGGRAAAAVGEPTPVSSRVTDSDHLRSAEFQIEALRYRETRLLDSVARRLHNRIQQQKMDSFEAFNECQDHILATAKASVERFCLEHFIEGVDAMQEGPNRDAVNRLRALYGLYAIESDRAWFLESGFIAANKSRAIRGQVNALCGEVRAQAEELVNALGVPDKLLPEIAR